MLHKTWPNQESGAWLDEWVAGKVQLCGLDLAVAWDLKIRLSRQALPASRILDLVRPFPRPRPQKMTTTS